MPPSVADTPEQLGRYEIVQRLSAGGMGEVFVARFAGPGGFLKPVALKRIHPHLASDEAFIHMLHDEANVTAAIKHPNVVQIIEVGAEGNSHYVVLDYVSGETLSKLRRELHRNDRRMPLWLVAWIGAEVASALHAAHEARSLEGEALEIIHRDVSLGNVMLADDGRPMLFDFGVAKAKQRLTHTTAGELKGKVSYMAPEIFHGAKVDRTVDLYALGVVLYELLTGKSPYQRDSDLETIAAIQNGEVPTVVEVRPDVDWLLDAIVMRTMAREREERYQTAAQVEQALREWARKNQQPHDSASAQKWLQENFADKLQERRALLARVASRQRLVPSASMLSGPAPTTNPTFGRSGGSTRIDEQPASVGALTPPPVTPSLSPPDSGSANSPASGLGDQAPRSRKWLGVAGLAGACVFGVIATLAATSGSRGAAPPPVDSSPAASAAPPTTATTAAPPPDPTPSATASVAASAAKVPAGVPAAKATGKAASTNATGGTATAAPTPTATPPVKKTPGLHGLD